MRKRYRVLILAAAAAAFMVPVGFALSLESPASDAGLSSTALFTAATLLQPVSSAAALLRPLSSGAALLLVGALLLSLAAFVRRAV